MQTSPVHSEALRRDLAALVSDGRASIDASDRAAYSRDLWPRQQIVTRSGVAAPSPPGVVVWPSSTEEVARVVRFAAERGIALVPYGAGSGVCGGVLPTPETIVLDVKRMRRIVALDRERLEARVEAGIIGQHLEDALATRGLTLGHFPSSIYCSTLGGWLAARSAGQCSGRYGKIEDMALGLTLVDGRGEIHHASVGGPGGVLVPLAIGSEGVLGVITEARLRVAPAPAGRRFAAWLFDETERGLDAIRHIYQAGLRPAVARLYDPFDTMLARRGGLARRDEGEHDDGHDDEHEAKPTRPGLGVRMLARALRRPRALNRLIDALPDRALGGAQLVLVWEDADEIARAEHEIATAICRDQGGRDAGEAPARRWLAHRHSVSYRQSPLFASGAFVDTMEVAATWSRLQPMYRAVRAALSPRVFVMAHFSHAYPDGGSIYFTFAGSAADDARCLEAYDATWRDALAAVERTGGTISHHHGVGRSKAPAMAVEQGTAVDLARGVKRWLDPKGILNPGSLFSLRTQPASTEAATSEDGSRVARFVDALARDTSAVVERAGSLAVVLPRNEMDLADVVRAAGRAGVGLTSPGAPAREHAVRVDLRRMATLRAIDDTSRIVHVDAGATLEAIELELEPRGLTFGVAPRFTGMSVGEWIARGTPGVRSRDEDPVAQTIAGLSAVLPDGTLLSIRPAPRRAVGPDFVSALIGARGRLGIVTAAHLVAHGRERSGEGVELAILFDARASAEAALAWIRGRGARAASTSLEVIDLGSRLTVRVNGPPGLRAARAALVRRVAEEHGGRVLPEDHASALSRRIADDAPPEPPSDALLEALARALDPKLRLG